MIADPAALGLFVVAGLVGGVVNSLAGGAKLFVFPMLVASGLPPLVANATGTVAVWPAQMPAAWLHRKTLLTDTGQLLRRLVPLLLGAVIGALALITSSERAFLAVIPALLILAVAAIVAGPRAADLLRAAVPRRRLGAATCALLFGCGLYGGYFGAGVGFMLIAVLLAADGLGIARANAEKNLLGVAMNTTTVVPLALSGLVDWVAAGAVIVGALAGGWAGARVSMRLPERPMRIGVAVVGVVLTLSFLFG